MSEITDRDIKVWNEMNEKLDDILQMLEDQAVDLEKAREEREDIVEKILNLSTDDDGFREM